MAWTGRRRPADGGWRWRAPQRRSGPAMSLVVAAAALTLGACQGSPDRAPRQVAQSPAERYVVRLTPVADMKPVAGEITAKRMADARARISGVLVRLDVKEGDEVRAGQVIGRVVDERIGLETRAYDAQVSAAEAQDARARADLARTRDLYDHGVYARARLDQVEAAAKAASGALGAARAQRAASAASGAQGAILAPAAGRVLQVEVPAGAVVTPGQSVAVVTAGERVIRIEAPEADMRALKVGDELTVTSADPARPPGRARVIQVYPAVEAGRVRADLSASGLEAAFVGQRVDIALPVGQRMAVVVPVRFVFSRYGVDYVRLVGRDGRAAEAPVQTAPTADPAAVEILSGLAPGDQLLAPGAAR